MLLHTGFQREKTGSILNCKGEIKSYIFTVNERYGCIEKSTQ